MKKLLTIDLFAFFSKFLIIILIGLTLFLTKDSLINTFALLFDSIEKKLAIYSSALDNQGFLGEFLISHNYNALGSLCYTIIERNQNIYAANLFLNIYDILKHVYMAVIFFFIFKLFHRYSNGHKLDKKNQTYLITIGSMLILIPFFRLLYDLIGCNLVNNLVRNPDNKLISYQAFNYFYLILGSLFIFSSLDLKLHENKIYKNLKKGLFIFFALLLLINAISSLINVIEVIKIDTSELKYHDMALKQDPFLTLISSYGVKLFGNVWTYLGLEASLKTAMIITYLLEVIYYLIATYLLVRLALSSFELSKKYFKTQTLNYVFVAGLFILKYLFIIISVLLVNSAHNQNEFSNSNFSFNLFNKELIWFIILTMSLLVNNLVHKDYLKDA